MAKEYDIEIRLYTIIYKLVEEMEDAMVNPDKHRDLMVRMGGYTEYFVNLSKEEQATLLTRTEHGE